MNIQELEIIFDSCKETALSGRYIHLGHISPLLEMLSGKIKIEEIGTSENGLPISMLTLGNGPQKILLWSQMHGNESTTTKALFDLFNYLLTKDKNAKTILKECTLFIIPILNPDGAFAYTRLNYQLVDLNRDAQDLTQKESLVLRNMITKIKPNIAFNLHGQRTIFSAGTTNHSATISFLSPAGDAERSVTKSRKIAMGVIAKMNAMLQSAIPDQVGRYDDGFNINCVGDTLCHMGVPTILFEAGHYQNDYDREETRKYIFCSYITSLSYIATHGLSDQGYEDYFLIPENDKCFYDVIIRDVMLKDKKVDIALQYEEVLENDRLKFVAKVAEIGTLEKYYGHREITGKKREIANEIVTVEIVQGVELTEFRLNSELFSV